MFVLRHTVGSKTLKVDTKAAMWNTKSNCEAPDLDVGLTNVLVPNVQVVSPVTYGCYG
jgi:hypothetical protein